MLLSFFNYDHCLKNVVDTWFTTAGIPVSHYNGEVGKGAFVTTAGAMTCPTGTNANRTLMQIDGGTFGATATKVFFGLRVTLTAAGSSGFAIAMAPSVLSSNTVSLGSFTDFFPASTVGTTMFVDYVYDIAAGTITPYYDGVAKTPIVLAAAFKTEMASTRRLYIFPMLSSANSAGVMEIRDFHSADDVAGDGITTRLGDRKILPIYAATASGAGWTPTSGASPDLLTVLTNDYNNAAVLNSPADKTPLVVGLGSSIPTGFKIDGVSLAISGRTTSATAANLKVDVKQGATAGTSTTLVVPTTLTYGQKLPNIPLAPDGGKWTDRKILATTLTMTPDA
jgi:hypothetical protein